VQVESDLHTLRPVAEKYQGPEMLLRYSLRESSSQSDPVVISFCVFMIIQLPPAATRRPHAADAVAGQVDMTEINQLRARYHMDRSP